MLTGGSDSKLDDISRKIDQLSHRMSQLSHRSNQTSSNQMDQGMSLSFGPTPASSSASWTPKMMDTKRHSLVGESANDLHHNPSEAEYEGESSLFAHALFASRFLQNVINTTTNRQVAKEMEVVLGNLRAALQSGKQPSDTLDKLYPRAIPLPPGQTTRSLALPPMGKVLMCLRTARESPQVSMLWLSDFIIPSRFNDYFIKVASPGPATEADLIIVHCGLCWLFHECAKLATDDDERQDQITQALLCEANLQTVLANLKFHQSVSMDVAYATALAVCSHPVP
jgi:hypothetical protein